MANLATDQKALAELFKLNRKCCDCNKPSTSFANLTIGSFVCLECSGLLREFGFRLKGLGLSTFTTEEIHQLNANGGNKRLNEIWLGKHPLGPNTENVAPKWDDVAKLRAFLVQKYADKAWYDAKRASIPAGELQVKAKSSAAALLSSSPQLQQEPGLFTLSPVTTGRKRADSNQQLIQRGSAALEQPRSFLSRPASGSISNKPTPTSSSSLGGEVELSENEEEDARLTSSERTVRQRERASRAIRRFYSIHNPEKLDSVKLFTDWVMYHGMSAFNKKLREKYGTDIKFKQKSLAATLSTPPPPPTSQQQPKVVVSPPPPPPPNLMDMDLEVLEQAFSRSANPFDSFDKTKPPSNNPFDDM